MRFAVRHLKFEICLDNVLIIGIDSEVLQESLKAFESNETAFIVLFCSRIYCGLKLQHRWHGSSYLCSLSINELSYFWRLHVQETYPTVCPFRSGASADYLHPRTGKRDAYRNRL